MKGQNPLLFIRFENIKKRRRHTKVSARPRDFFANIHFAISRVGIKRAKEGNDNSIIT